MTDTSATEPEATEEPEQSESGEYQSHTQQQAVQQSSEQETLPDDNEELQPAEPSEHTLDVGDGMEIDGHGEATVEAAPEPDAEPEATGEE